MKTHRRFFREDFSRALAIADCAASLKQNSEVLARDLQLSAIAMAVGAMDACFSDLYVDCLAKVLQHFLSG